MDWSFGLRILLPLCYVVLVLVVIRNLAVLSTTDCSTPANVAKRITTEVEQLYPPNTSRSISNESDSGHLSKAQRLPDCIIIGVRKGGTRALLDAVALHPQVRIVRHEVHFFDVNQTYNKGLEWYRSQMPVVADAQVTIEKTPAYFTNVLAPQRVYKMNPNLKLILIIREPVSRAISDYTQVLCIRLEQNKSLNSFENEAFLADGTTVNTDYKPVRNSLYAVHMKQWLKYFPLKNFLIIDGDKFTRKPLPELRRVERFLHLTTSIRSDQLVYDPSKHFFCFRRRTTAKIKCLGNSKGRPHANVSERTKMFLRKNFAPYNEEFFHLVNRRWFW
uniref:Sulfotransfer_1 domain-containing protein n=1 Tax=Syphacia muris TaxID=451379 RepID=A0A0N5APP7_9BILA